MISRRKNVECANGVYCIVGRGTVITGRLERGVIKKGDDAVIMGYGKQLKTTVTGIEMFRQLLDRAEAGDQMGALLRGLKKEDLRRGQVLAKPGTIAAFNHFAAQVTADGWLTFQLIVICLHVALSCAVGCGCWLPTTCIHKMILV